MYMYLVDYCHPSCITYVFEWLLQLSKLVKALLHHTGRPLVHFVVLVGGCTQHTFNGLYMMCFN